jgi:hypothetical protein
VPIAFILIRFRRCVVWVTKNVLLNKPQTTFHVVPSCCVQWIQNFHHLEVLYHAFLISSSQPVAGFLCTLEVKLPLGSNIRHSHHPWGFLTVFMHLAIVTTYFQDAGKVPEMHKDLAVIAIYFYTNCRECTSVIILFYLNFTLLTELPPAFPLSWCRFRIHFTQDVTT